jgi:hypothetical protein
VNPDGFLLDPEIDGDGVMQLRVGRRRADPENERLVVADLEFADDLAVVRMLGAGLIWQPRVCARAAPRTSSHSKQERV